MAQAQEIRSMKENKLWIWSPALLLFLGACATYGGVREQRVMPLRAPLETSVPTVLQGHQAKDIVVSQEEQDIAGMDEYIMRMYETGTPGAPESAFSVYVGYYETQSQGSTIHSPKNCLPGNGWEPLVSSREVIQTASGDLPVNRYLIGNGPAKALVLYWYQGRGQLAANEYLVKWHLLRDQATMGRSDEALVRIIVPVIDDEAEAYELAVRIAKDLVPAVDTALPV
jgi:EpsI family protein